jgi:hypothetical protein
MSFAADNGIPVIRFRAGERKADVVKPYFDAVAEPGVVALGIAQEVQHVTMGTAINRDADSGLPHYTFARRQRRVTVFYFYIYDDNWGPCFIKLCAYFPYPGKLWCNGHEWVKRQLEKKHIDYVPWPAGSLRSTTPRLCGGYAAEFRRTRSRSCSTTGWQ